MVADITFINIVTHWFLTPVLIPALATLIIFALLLLFFVIVQCVSDVTKLGRHSVREALQTAIVTPNEYGVAYGGSCILEGTLLALLEGHSEVEYHARLNFVFVAPVDGKHIFFVARANTEAEV